MSIQVTSELRTNKSFEDLGECRQVGDWAVGVDIGDVSVAFLWDGSDPGHLPTGWELTRFKGHVEEMRNKRCQQIYTIFQDLRVKRITSRRLIR
jgi:hypothetical protein